MFIILKEPLKFSDEIQDLMTQCGNSKRLDKAQKWFERNFGIKEQVLF